MDKQIILQTITVLIASVISSFSMLFGNSYKHMLVLIILMIVDTIFGWAKGFKKGNWKSKKARWGLIGKIVELMFIMILYLVQRLFDIQFLVYIGLYYFILVEIASIIENYGELNHNLPKGILKIVLRLKATLGSMFIVKTNNILNKVMDMNDDENNKKDYDTKLK